MHPVVHKDTQVWKEKEVHKGEKCRVTYHNASGDYGVDGGYGDVYIEVTDETSQLAYETMRQVLYDLSPRQAATEEKVTVNKRASQAVDVR